MGEEPKVIEYNVRLGDPETEVVLPRLKTDLLSILTAVHTGRLNEITLEIEPKTAATVMAVSGGYPEAYEKGKQVKGLENTELVFHAGTRLEGEQVVTNGGRVLAATSFGESFNEAVTKSFETLEKINFEGMHYRKDIGFDL